MMVFKNILGFSMAVLTLFSVGSHAVPACAQKAWETILAFEEVPTNTFPATWKSDATHNTGEPAAWAVIEDYAAPSGHNVLALRKVQNNPGSVFNICWTSQPAFRDGEIEVKVRADSGKADQGGGPIWRVKDGSNYYVARYNPLENNFRLYCVKDGDRKLIADAKDIPIKTGEWFTIKIVHQGDEIEAWLNGKKLLHATDKTLPESGGVGVWTKADAASSFDDLALRTPSK